MRRYVGLLGIIIAAGALTAQAVKMPKPEYGMVGVELAVRLPRAHLLQKPFDETVSAVAWTNLITSYDPDRTYFTQEDIASFEPMRLQICNKFKAGDVKFGFEVYERFCARLDDRFNYVTNALAQTIDVSADEMFEWERKDAPWPKNKAEQAELWRKRLKNDYLVGTLNKEFAKESAVAKTNAPAASTNTAVTATNETAVVTNAAPILTTEENIIKRYRQLSHLMQDMDEETIFQRYASAVCTAYDPHTDYLSPMREEDFAMEMNLKLVGIGAQLRAEDGMARIMEIIPGGPAARDTRDIRLVPGDKIIGVGQGDGAIEDIIHMSLNRAVRKIRGEKGTKVVLSVIPASDPSGSTTKLVDLLRDEIKLEDSAVTGRVERVTLPNGVVMKLGYIKVPSFYGSGNRASKNHPDFRSVTYDVHTKVTEFNAQDVEGFILDLRGNGGGLLPEAINMSGVFVQSGPIVQVRERNRCTALPVMGATVPMRKPLVVLIDHLSASASEIVAGALQDYGRAIIIGDTQTHGKGTVQTVLPLNKPETGSVKVTTASFYRITGASTQIKGVRSDITLPSIFEQMDIGENKIPNALPWSQIDPAEYTRLSDTSTYIPALKEKSAERLAKNPKYLRHTRLLREAEKMNDKKALPLEINARRELMRSERETRKELETEEDEELDNVVDAKKKKGSDIVLEEAFRILADYTTLCGGTVFTEGDSLRNRMLRIFRP